MLSGGLCEDPLKDLVSMMFRVVYSSYVLEKQTIIDDRISKNLEKDINLYICNFSGRNVTTISWCLDVRYASLFCRTMDSRGRLGARTKILSGTMVLLS